MSYAIETFGLGHRYRRTTALVDVDLEVPEGSLFALLGPNGAGKTTLMRILLGLLRPTHGDVRIAGSDPVRLTSRERQRIAYVAEGQELPGWMTVGGLQSWLAPLYERWDAPLARHLQERFRLDPNRRIKHLSRGERMKAALLVALAPRPEVLVMDEPFTGMDALVKDELVYGLLELTQGEDWTVLLCSHDIGELEALADHVAFLERGRLILSEPLDVLRSRFRVVEARVRNGTLTDLSGLPPMWLSPRRAGQRISFVTCEHGAEGWEASVRENLPGVEELEARPASLREVFVALAAEGLGGRDWESQGGLR